MPRYTYNRDAIPIGEEIVLEVQFADVSGNAKDCDSTPQVAIFDATDAQVRALLSTDVYRVGPGRYRLEYTIETGFASGVWSDAWEGAVDGYGLTAQFNFTVNSAGSIIATGTVVDPIIEIGDDPWPSLMEYTQEAKANINVLLK